MITVPNRVYLFIAFMLMIAVVVIWKLNRSVGIDTKATHSAVPQFRETGAIADSQASVQTDALLGVSVPAVSKPLTREIQTLAGTPSEAAEVQDWFVKHGRTPNNDDYASYDQVTLEKLAVNGDIRAMHTLAKVYLKPELLMLPEYGFEGARLQLWNAAVYGSTQAFSDLGLNTEVKSINLEKDPAAKRTGALEILALYKVAEMRGDRLLVLSQTQFDQKVAASTEEKQYVETRAQQIYKQLQDERRMKGLGEFDNSVPDTVKKFFENYEKSP